MADRCDVQKRGREFLGQDVLSAIQVDACQAKNSAEAGGEEAEIREEKQWLAVDGRLFMEIY